MQLFTTIQDEYFGESVSPEEPDHIDAVLTPELESRLLAGPDPEAVDEVIRLLTEKHPPPNNPAANAGDDRDEHFGGLIEPPPTAMPPCTAGKLEELCRRRDAGLALFNRRDVPLPDRAVLASVTRGNGPVVCGAMEQTHDGLRGDPLPAPPPRRPRACRSPYQQALSLDPVARAAEAGRKRVSRGRRRGGPA